jgi:SAM-dependent methyltransferase
VSEPPISNREWERLCEQASRRYQASGTYHRKFVRGKLRHDPLYRKMLEPGVLPREGRLVDLGCGRGILLSLLQSGESRLALEGVERRPSMARVARAAAGSGATIRIADVAEYVPGPADVILLLDVLQYLRPDDQERVLGRAREALKPGGTLWIREPDAALGTRFVLTWIGERICALGRLHWRQRYHYRSSSEWLALLARVGFTASARPLWAGTPLANVLIEAR